MGKLRFPIDKLTADKIPDFQDIFIRYDSMVEDLCGMLTYLCYRFDTGCDEVRNAKGVEDKSRVATQLSDWSPPEAVIGEEDDGTPLYSPEWDIYMEVVGEYFLQAADETIEYLASLQIMMSNSNKIMRMPIDGKPDIMTKTLLNVQKASEGVMTARESQAQVLKELADEDVAYKRAIMAKVKQKRAQTSPDGTGRHTR
jgi:hypothetical protein